MRVLELIPFLCMVCGLVFGVMVYVSRPNRPANVAFLGVALVISAWLGVGVAGSSFALYSNVAHPEVVTIWLYRLGNVCGVMIAPFFALLRAAIVGQHEGWPKIFRRARPWFICPALVAVFVLTPFYLESVGVDRSRGWTAAHYNHAGAMVVLFASIGMGIALSVRVWRDNRSGAVVGVRAMELRYVFLGFLVMNSVPLVTLVAVIMREILGLAALSQKVWMAAPMLVVVYTLIIAYGVSSRSILDVRAFVRRVISYLLLAVYGWCAFFGALWVIDTIFETTNNVLPRTEGSNWSAFLSSLATFFLLIVARGPLQRISAMLVPMEGLDFQRALTSAEAVLGSVAPMPELVREFLRIVRQETGSNRAVVLMGRNEAARGGLSNAVSQAIYREVGSEGEETDFTYGPLVLNENDPLVQRVLAPQGDGLVSVERMERQGEDMDLMARMGEMDASVLVAVLHRGGPAAILCVGGRPGGRIYGEEGMDVLRALADRLGLAISNARLYTEARRSQAYSHTLVEELSAGVVAVAPNGTLTVINREASRLLGFASGETRGGGLVRVGSDLVCLHPLLVRVLRLALAGEVIRDQTVELAGPPHVELLVSALPFGSVEQGGTTGASAGAVLVLNDYTEINNLQRQVNLSDRAARDEAERANTAKSEFLSRMSHEFRTPLNAILGFGQLLDMGQPPDATTEMVGHILSAGKHLLGLVDEVLDIAKLERDQLEMVFDSVPVRRVVDEAIALIVPAAERAKVTLSLDENEALDQAVVIADERRLRQIMINLLSNAVKYNWPGGYVVTTVSFEEGPKNAPETAEPPAEGLGRGGPPPLQTSPPPGGYWCLTVADTGRGIAPENLDRLFTPFERGAAKDGIVEGSGLGLALCKRLADAMQGVIVPKSTPGQGSEFTVKVPAAAATENASLPAAPASVEGDPALGVVVTGERTVLCVEDNAANLRLVEHLVRMIPNTRLVAAKNGIEGLQAIRTRRPDVVLLDLNLPGMPGWEILENLKHDPTTAAIPVIVISADASPWRISSIRQAGATDYLTKPLGVETFMKSMKAVLSGETPPAHSESNPGL